MRITVPSRLAFPSIFEKSAAGDGKPSFNLKGIIDPTDKRTVKVCEDAIVTVAKEKWGAKADKIMAAFVRTGKKPDVFFVKDDYRNQSGDTYDGFEDMFYVSAKSDDRPTVVDRDRTPLSEDDGKPYAGAHVNLILEIWPQDNKWGKAVRAELKGVQFVRDGAKFSGGGPAAAPDDFEDLGDQGEDDDDVSSLA